MAGDEWDSDTDPSVFGPAATVVELEADEPPERADAAVTKRHCSAQCGGCGSVCGAELPPCDCARAARAAVAEVLEVLIEHLVNSGRYTRVEAAGVANALAAEAGVTLL